MTTRIIKQMKATKLICRSLQHRPEDWVFDSQWVTAVDSNWILLFHEKSKLKICLSPSLSITMPGSAVTRLSFPFTLWLRICIKKWRKEIEKRRIDRILENIIQEFQGLELSSEGV